MQYELILSMQVYKHNQLHFSHAKLCDFINVGMKTYHIGIVSLWSPVDTDICGLHSLHIGLHWSMYWNHTPLQISHIINYNAAEVSMFMCISKCKVICSLCIHISPSRQWLAYFYSLQFPILHSIQQLDSSIKSSLVYLKCHYSLWRQPISSPFWVQPGQHL